MKIQIKENGQYYTLGGDYTPTEAVQRINDFCSHYYYRDGHIGTHVKTPGQIKIKREFRIVK